MNKPNQTKHEDTETRVMVTRGDRVEGRGEGKIGNGDQLYSDGWK